MPEEKVKQQTFYDVASLDELEEGGLKTVTVGKRPVVLMRREGQLHALGAKCPHQGAPFGNGAYCKSRVHGDVLVCPWHKAAFSAETGEVVEPIAFEGLPRYPVEVVQGRIIVGIVPLPPSVPVPHQKDEHVLILGAGAAAASAIYTLRKGGFAGDITLIGDEKWAPYDRTTLSKSFLLAEPTRRRAPSLLPNNYYTRYNIKRVEGLVTAFDPQTKRAKLEDGTTYQGDHVLIATGGQPYQLDIPGITLEGVMSLHSQSDALLLAERITPEQSIVLIGGGLIGLEVASSLRQKGIGVTVVSNEAVPMEAQFGREIGTRLLQLHEDNSVAFISDAKVVQVYGEEKVEGIELDDGMRLPCSHVLVATGVRPRSDFVTGLPQGPEKSILVDGAMQAVPGVYAAGDVSALKRNGKMWRIDHWRHAQIQGRIAAQSIMGLSLEEVPIPWFWTQQFGKKIEYLGWGEGFDQVMLEGSLEDFKFLAIYTLNNRIVGVSGAGRAADVARAAFDFESFTQEKASSVSV